MPSVSKWGIGICHCPPSIPPPSDPIVTLSRAEAQLACLETSTLLIPYLAKKPFSLAIIKGADSTMGIKPSLIFVTSGACSGLIFATGTAVVAGELPVLAVGSGGLPKHPFKKMVLAAETPAVIKNFLRE